MALPRSLSERPAHVDKGEKFYQNLGIIRSRDVSAKGQGLTIGLPSNIFRITFVIHLGKPVLQAFYDLSCLLG